MGRPTTSPRAASSAPDPRGAMVTPDPAHGMRAGDSSPPAQ
ncbi:MAG: hypothetical protein ACFCBW_00855 [Candidatus Competibacterales bacterium]